MCVCMILVYFVLGGGGNSLCNLHMESPKTSEDVMWLWTGWAPIRLVIWRSVDRQSHFLNSAFEPRPLVNEGKVQLLS